MSTANPEVEYEGYLEKWTNYASGYKQRGLFCTLVFCLITKTSGNIRRDAEARFC